MKTKDLKSAILFGNIKSNPTRYFPLLFQLFLFAPRRWGRRRQMGFK